MSREEQEYIVSDGMKQIPIKWTAPEALNYGKYTSLCDVWSFGVLCWEVFSRGGTPYSGLSNTRSRQMISAGILSSFTENCFRGLPLCSFLFCLFFFYSIQNRIPDAGSGRDP